MAVGVIFAGFMAGNGRLTASFASNRTSNQNTENRTKTEKTNVEIPKVEDQTSNQEVDETIEEQSENEVINNLSEKYNFSNPYFNIVDSNYNELSNYITFAPKADKFKGKTIKVRGFAIKEADYLTNEYFLIGKYAISCCAADAGVVGFIAKYDNNKIVQDKWYEIEGILEKGTDKDGYDIMYIEVINVREISSKSEEQYVYPCYSYGDGSCRYYQSIT